MSADLRRWKLISKKLSFHSSGYRDIGTTEAYLRHCPWICADGSLSPPTEASIAPDLGTLALWKLISGDVRLSEPA
jgi:hypothetical protein